MHRLQLAPFHFGVALAAPAAAGEVSHSFNWRDMPREAYPGAYWFWLGSAVTRDELERDIKMRAHAGIRTLRFDLCRKRICSSPHQLLLRQVGSHGATQGKSAINCLIRKRFSGMLIALERETQ